MDSTEVFVNCLSLMIDALGEDSGFFFTEDHVKAVISKATCDKFPRY
jgi:hypothetical protein